MRTLHDRASQRNNFQVIPLSRPRIEAARDVAGWYILRGEHGWLCGDRRQALAEFAGLERIERWGST
jgi:hypothetical protein